MWCINIRRTFKLRLSLHAFISMSTNQVCESRSAREYNDNTTQFHREFPMLFMRHTLLTIALLLPLLAINSYAQTQHFNLEDWPQTNRSLKPMYVKAIMEQAGVHQVSFNKKAEFYVAELDKFAAFAQEKNYRHYLKTSVAQNLATIAVINCDWSNGVPPWEFAQKYLGAEQIELLQPLYSDAITTLKSNCDKTTN